MSTDILSTLAGGSSEPLPDGDSTDESYSWDAWLLIIVGLLIGFGLIMQYSASAVMASQKLGDHLYLVESQLQKVAVGVLLMVGALRVHYRWWRRLVYPALGVAVLLLVLVAIPGIGTVHNGARRWFSIMGASFQPAELVKIITVIYLAYSVSKKGERMGSFAVGFVPHLMMIGVMVALLLLQPDFGSSVILVTMMMLMLFVSGARILYLLILSGFGAFGAYIAITGSEYRMKRILAFLDPWSYRQDIGYQISESLIAIGSGGVTGRGLGQGNGKLGYVPELWNDFIGTIVAEELGLFGMIVLVMLFLGFIWRGLTIAFEARDDFGMYLAFGLTALVALQATANLCVVTGLLPTKGLTLPFVSFGGSAMISSMLAVGILLSISRGAPDRWEQRREERERRREQKRWEKKRDKILDRRDDLRSRFRS